MTPLPVAPNENDDDFLRILCCVDVESLDDHFMRGSIGNVVQEPDVTEDVRQFVFIMYGSHWDKRVLTYQIMIVEQLYALITGYGNMTSSVKRTWLDQFKS